MMIPTMQPVSQSQVYTKYCISVNGEKLDQVVVAGEDACRRKTS